MSGGRARRWRWGAEAWAWAAAGRLAAPRRQRGRLRAHDPAWAPRAVPGIGPPGEGRPRRVLFLLESSLPHVHGGYALRSATVIAAAREAGAEPLAMTRLGFPASRGTRGVRGVETVEGVEHRRLDLPGLRHYTAVPLDRLVEANAALAGPIARELRPDAIWAATPHLNGLVGLALRGRSRLPLVYDVRGFPEKSWAAEHGVTDEAYELRRAAETRVMRAADLVVTLSETMAAEIESRGVARERLLVLPHALEPQRRGGVEEAAAEWAGMGTPPGACLVGVVSSLRAYEGVGCLLEAVAAGRRRGARLRLVVAGDGPARAGLERRAGELGLGAEAVFAGRLSRERALALYPALDVVAVPRLDAEVCRAVTPLKAVEAMAMGSCLAMSDLPPLRELAGGGERAMLVPPGDPARLGAALAELASAPQKRSSLGRAAAAWAATECSFPRLVAATGSALARLGQGRPEGADRRAEAVAP
jgi:glycosyltransferase involved in cell wall biosynthesis